MSGSLENRSSLRKLEFPSCSQEALNRLYSSISAAALKASPTGSTTASLSPKETDLVLEIISEFVFFTKSKSKRLSSVQELQLMQVITDFFQSKAVDIPMERLTDNPKHQAYFSQFAVLNNLFNFLFMEPPNSTSSKSDDKMTYRMRSLFKLTSITMGLKNSTILKCLGAWLHREGPNSERGRQLCEAVLNEFVLLVPDSIDALKSLPVIAPLFAAHLMTALGDIYTMDLPLKAPATTKTYSSTIISTTSNRPNIPPKSVVDMVTSWMGEGGEELDPDRGENRMLPAMTPVLETAACMGSMHSAVVPLIGLAKWTCIYPLIAKVHGTESIQDHDTYARLHVGILECITDAHQKRKLLRAEIISSKKVVTLINDVRVTLDNYGKSEGCPATQECLDRLGQFLNCLFTGRCIHGKLDELSATLKHLPQNNMISILANTMRS